MMLSNAIRIINIFYGIWWCSVSVVILLSISKWTITLKRKKSRAFIKDTSDTKK